MKKDVQEMQAFQSQKLAASDETRRKERLQDAIISYYEIHHWDDEQKIDTVKQILNN
jgi:hypothetical protein